MQRNKEMLGAQAQQFEMPVSLLFLMEVVFAKKGLCRHRKTYADVDWDGFIDANPQSPELWGNFGEDGRDESVTSSMSECEEGGFVDFFFPKACLNELLN